MQEKQPYNDPSSRSGPSSEIGNPPPQQDTFQSIAIEIPQISLPKGGGALKGIDEKFQVNPSNGTSSFSIPLPLSPNRNGFTPALSISYNSGAGNGVLGIGWGLDFPSIQRKTDKTSGVDSSSGLHKMKYTAPAATDDLNLVIRSGPLSSEVVEDVFLLVNYTLESA